MMQIVRSHLTILDSYSYLKKICKAGKNMGRGGSEESLVIDVLSFLRVLTESSEISGTQSAFPNEFMLFLCIAFI
jgi:hypothetical protein